MAEEVEIEPEFEDEDDFTTRLDELSKRNKQSTPDTTAPPVEGAPPVEAEEAAIPPGTRQFKPRRKNKENQKLLEQAQREAERKRRQDQTEARRLLREQQQDQAREQRAQAKEALRISREQVTSARSDAIAGRVQSYSLAASIGLPGYVAASVVDSMYIRPKEEAAVQAEKQYQLDLQRYNEQLRKDQIEAKRRQEQAIRDMPIDATPINKDTGKPLPPSAYWNNPPVPPSNVPPPGGLPPGNISPPGNQPPQGPPPGNLPGAIPPPVPPKRPNISPTGALGSLSQAAIPITVAIQAAQFLNQAIDKLAENINSTAVSIAKGDGSEASKGLVKTTKSFVDPLGVNIPLNVAVQSFDTLIDVNKAILESTKQNLAFAPKSLTASVEGDIRKLIQTIELSQRLDPTTAELIKANTQFEMAWAELRAEFIEGFGPTIVSLLRLMTDAAKLHTGIMNGNAESILNLNPVLSGILPLLNRIAGNTEKDNPLPDDIDLVEQINRFFDTTEQRSKMRMNNTFPNP